VNNSENFASIYTNILRKELVPAFGCTEPIAVALCAAKARQVLGAEPEYILIEASGNIIKNVKSVIVPNTNGLKGTEAAAAAGVVAGKAELELEVISALTEEDKKNTASYLERTKIEVKALASDEKLDLIVTVKAGEDTAFARIARSHANFVHIEKNGEVLLHNELAAEMGSSDGKEHLTVDRIVDFAENADLEQIRPILARQIAFNSAIAKEGLENNWGANIGSTLLAMRGDNVQTRAMAWAAAGSDARMSGCELPVVINSGSGNQGITCSLPVIVYAKDINAGEDELMRALIVSNLIGIHIKSGIGALSAYCGAVSAGSAAACGIAFLNGGRYDAIAHTLVNSIAIISGTICDGAKPSCAAKIASAVDAGILGYEMYLRGEQFYGGEGIVLKGVENTIRNIGRLGADGMLATDEVIIDIMTGC